MRKCRTVLASPNWQTDASGKLHLWTMTTDATHLLHILSTGATPEKLDSLVGHWALIDERGDDTIIASDRLRSHPLVYSYSQGEWVISDDIESLRSRVNWSADGDQSQIFLHTGFTLGSATLLQQICSTEAASLTTLKANGEASTHLYAAYHYATDSVSNPEEFSSLFSTALDTCVERMLNFTDDRQLVVPLSGGLDSRLLVAWLKKFDAPKITTFTYGKASSPEVAISRKVAEDLDVDWFTVDLDSETIRTAWNSAEAEEFVRATWKGTSLPHIQDWFPLTVMSKDHLVDDDAVFLPGHTIVGNMHDEDLLAKQCTEQDVLDALALHHANLQGKGTKLTRNRTWHREISRVQREVGYGTTSRTIQEFIEWFNLKHRQAKYINNSVAAYEHYGYSWALPMLDREIWDTWLQGSQDLTATRQWYAQFTAQEFEKITGKNVKLFQPSSIRMNSAIKKPLVRMLRLTHVDRLLSRYRSIRTMLDHPMAFEAFADLPEWKQALQYVRGVSQMGLWTQAFLTDGWGTEDALVEK